MLTSGDSYYVVKARRRGDIKELQCNLIKYKHVCKYTSSDAEKIPVRLLRVRALEIIHIRSAVIVIYIYFLYLKFYA